jgi:hypothetical protein
MNAGRTNVQCTQSCITCGKISRYSKNLFVQPRGHRPALSISNLKYEFSNRTIAARWARGSTIFTTCENGMLSKYFCHNHHAETTNSGERKTGWATVLFRPKIVLAAAVGRSIRTFTDVRESMVGVASSNAAKYF